MGFFCGLCVSVVNGDFKSHSLSYRIWKIMALLDTVPAFIRVLMVFMLLLLAIRKGFSLGNAFFLGAVALGLFFGLSPLSLIRSIFLSFSHPKTLSLAIIVSLILVLSHSMELAGQMKRLLHRFQGIITKPSINLVIFPALIGLLPMPGGAIFSAPMVKTLGKCLNLSTSQLSYINYWFRHIWEYWWPLYPGVLLTMTLADLDLWTFVLFLFPLTLIALAAGYWPLKALRNGGTAKECAPPVPRPPLKPFLKELLPILIVIGLGLGSGNLLTLLLTPHAIAITQEIGLIFALLVAIAWVWRENRLSAAQKRQILLQKRLINIFYMVGAILVFKGMLEDSHAVEAISQELIRWRIPLMPICIILPFFVGSIVGITIAFVGTTFPILVSLIQSAGEVHFMLPYMMLALVSGFVGVLLSPLHLCLLLSNEYFGTPLAPVYRHLWGPSCVLILVGCLYFFVLHGFP